MSIGHRFEHKGRFYERIFLDGSTRLPSEVHNNLNGQVIDMIRGGRKRKNVKGEGFEGLVVRVGYSLVGTSAGYDVKAELDVEGFDEKVSYRGLYTPDIITEEDVRCN